MSNKKIPYWKHRLHEIVYEADTLAGKRFDLILLILILLSVILVMLESVTSIHNRYATEFNILEWLITGLFTLEYIVRLIAINKPFSYVFSFYGIIDLLSLVPSFIGIGLGANNISSIKNIRTIYKCRNCT